MVLPADVFTVLPGSCDGDAGAGGVAALPLAETWGTSDRGGFLAPLASAAGFAGWVAVGKNIEGLPV
jgi:hypothetical protein